MHKNPPYATAPEIARRLGVPPHRVRRVINRESIVPCMRVGVSLLYGEDQIRQIEAGLKRVRAWRKREVTNA